MQIDGGASTDKKTQMGVRANGSSEEGREQEGYAAEEGRPQEGSQEGRPEEGYAPQEGDVVVPDL